MERAVDREAWPTAFLSTPRAKARAPSLHKYSGNKTIGILAPLIPDAYSTSISDMGYHSLGAYGSRTERRGIESKLTPTRILVATLHKLDKAANITSATNLPTPCDPQAARAPSGWA